MTRLTNLQQSIIKAFVFWACLFSIAAATAQNFEEVKSKRGGFDVSTGTATQKSLVIEGKTYDIFKTAKGKQFLNLLSPRTGNNYALWIGEATEHKYNGLEVRKSSSGKYFIIVMSKNTKNPYNKYLKEVK